MRCNGNDRREELAALILGELADGPAAELERHLETCATCESLRQVLRDEERWVRSTFHAIATNESSAAQELVEPRQHRRAVRSSYKWLSAAAVIAFAAILVGSPWFTSSQTAAFADAIAPLIDGETLVCDMFMYVPRQGREPQTAAVRLYTDGRRVRIERRDRGVGNRSTRLADKDSGVDFNPSTRKFKRLEGGTSGDFLAPLQDLAKAKSDRALGEQDRDGRRVRGFETTIDAGDGRKNPVTVWADLRTGKPTSIVISFGPEAAGARQVFKNMRWGEPLDDDLFTLPADCTEYAPPSALRKDEVLGVRQLRDGVTLTLSTLVGEDVSDVVTSDFQWVALRRDGEQTILIMRLSDTAWKRVARMDPWALNLNDQLESAYAVDSVSKDFEHHLLLFDVTVVAERIEQWLTPVESEVSVASLAPPKLP